MKKVFLFDVIQGRSFKNLSPLFSRIHAKIKFKLIISLVKIKPTQNK